MTWNYYLKSHYKNAATLILLDLYAYFSLLFLNLQQIEHKNNTNSNLLLVYSSNMFYYNNL